MFSNTFNTHRVEVGGIAFRPVFLLVSQVIVAFVCHYPAQADNDSAGLAPSIKSASQRRLSPVQSVSDCWGAAGGWLEIDWGGLWDKEHDYKVTRSGLLDQSHEAQKREDWTSYSKLTLEARGVPRGFQWIECFRVFSKRPRWRLMARTAAAYTPMQSYLGLKGIKPNYPDPAWKFDEVTDSLYGVRLDCIRQGKGPVCQSTSHTLNELWGNSVVLCEGEGPTPPEGTEVVLTFSDHRISDIPIPDMLDTVYWLENSGNPRDTSTEFPELCKTLPASFFSQWISPTLSETMKPQQKQSWQDWLGAISGTIFSAWSPEKAGQATLQITVSKSGSIKAEIGKSSSDSDFSNGLLKAVEKVTHCEKLSFPTGSTFEEVQFNFNAAVSADQKAGQAACWNITPAGDSAKAGSAETIVFPFAIR